jgi:hypothetical protein
MKMKQVPYVNRVSIQKIPSEIGQIGMLNSYHRRPLKARHVFTDDDLRVLAYIELAPGALKGAEPPAVKSRTLKVWITGACFPPVQP